MTGFWDWRTQPNTAVAERPVTETAEPKSALEPVEIYTATAMVHGLIESDGRRLSTS